MEVAILRRIHETTDRGFASRFLFFGTNGLNVNHFNFLPHVILNSAVKERQVTQGLPADAFGTSYFYGYSLGVEAWFDIIGNLPGIPMEELDSRQDYVRERILKTTVNTVCNCASVIFRAPIGQALKRLDEEGRLVPGYEELGGYE